MKKLLLAGAAASLLLGACSEESASKETTAANKETAEKAPDAKQELMRFYMSIPQTINAVDADLNVFESAQLEGTLPKGDELNKMKEAAAAAAKEAGATVEGIEIPESLADHKADIEGAFASIKESYSMKADELTKDASLEAANEKFMEADEVFNKMLEEQGLAASSILNEVSK
jgi:Asp-tRNA(Asn)/Glu-tRNA(Gln) amidotransferase A subunit family amidase